MILPGYEVTGEVHRGRRRAVWRGRRLADGLSVIIKAPSSEFPLPAEQATLRREFRILEGLGVPGVAVPVELVTHRDRVTLVMEDLGDLSLKGLIAGGPLPIARVLAIGIELSAVLGVLHRRGIIHKDVNPNNIMVDAGTGRVTLIDFGIASRLSNEWQSPSHPQALEGTIAYMSPEQTGRMGRDVDYRTDLYSLGVTLFEALTGRIPFESSDPLEVIHGHVARQPEPPHARRGDVPAALSELVLRLMAKDPEERYQGARGVAADLERFAAEWAAAGTITPRRLGTEDVPQRFVVARRLYGREAEVRQLRGAIERVAAGGSELVLVSGYSGIGKTSLIRDLFASLTAHKGHLIAGKFDQLSRDVPYRAIAQAFSALMLQLLAESERGLEQSAERLRAALGANAQVIIDVVPELERVIGPQPAPAALGPAEAQARFAMLFRRFAGVMARPEHPLVVFLDDLQWADAATLALLPFLMADQEVPGLLLIGAYRDNEVSANHPLRLALTDLAARGVRSTQVSLPPLDERHLGQLVADTLRTDVASAAPATGLILDKTGGNPFFVKQLLESFHREGVIAFDDQAGCWAVDLDAAARAEAADNVLMLMAAKIARLEAPAQHALRLASCVGNRFDLQTLATISEAEPAAAAWALWPAVDEGLVVPLDKSYGFAPDLSAGLSLGAIRYQFLHDRVQQAAYAMIPEADRRQVHLTIGRLLLGQGGPPVAPEALFDVVNHLNYGRDLVGDPAELGRLAELNLAAGRRAKASAAYPSALGYFTTGTELLGPEAWRERHDLAFALHLERGEAEYLTGRMPEAEATFLALLARCDSPLEHADVAALLIVEYETLSRYDAAIAAGLDGLRRLGIDIPADPMAWDQALAAEMDAIGAAIGERAIASLADLPALEDETLHRAMRLLQATWVPAYVSGKGRLGDLVVARLVLLSLRHGNSEASAFGYLHHAITVGSVFGQYERGADLGQLALAVNDRFQDQRLRAVVHHRFAALVNPWRRPFADCVVHAREAVRAALESGNLPVVGYAQFQQAWYGMMIAPDLMSFLEEHRPTVDLLMRLQITAYADMQRIMMQWAEALQGRTATPTDLSGPDFDEAAYRATIGQGGIFRALHATVRLDLLSTFGRDEEACRYAAAEAEAVEVFVGSIWPAMFAFRHALALAATLPGRTEGERREAEDRLAGIEARLGRWAESAPDNFRHLHLLVSAERARVQDRIGDAVQLYEAALEAAGTQASPRHRALVNELYAEFWLGRGQPKVALVFLAEARYGYAQWGATAKVAQLEQRHASLLRPEPAPPAPPPGQVLETTGTLENALDVTGIMKAAQAITRVMDLERLLERMMGVALETAGADRGVLLLERDGRPNVRVVGTPDQVTVEPEPGVPLEERDDLPQGVVQFVRRTGDAVVIADATLDERSAHDPYIIRQRPRSLLCTPVLNQGVMIGVLYVENRLTAAAFTERRVRVLQLLSAQAAIAIENARLYERARQEVAERTRAEFKLRSVAEGTAAVTANEFFPSLVRHLAQGLKVRYAFVTECVGADHRRVRTLAFWSGDGLVGNVEYPLEGTPCEQVCTGEICFYPRDVRRMFPNDSDLQTLGAESYLGMPLLGTTGNVLGHLAVLDTERMAPGADDLALVRIFAARAGAELERKQTGEALRASQLQYSTMAETVPEVLFTADARGLADYVSRRFTEYTGMPLPQSLGNGWTEAVHPEDREPTGVAWGQAVASGTPFELEFRLRRSDGEYRWFRTRAVPVTGEGSMQWFGVATDIDDSKRAESALRAALEEVRRLKDRLEKENTYLQEQIESVHGFEEIIGRSAVLRRVLSQVEQVAPTDTTVLITGETGTGKELLARAIHRRSPRKDHPLVTVNCGAIAPGLVESELFGHEKGAFTGALSRRLGRFEVADGGTLFLDEIGDLPLDLQVKLLRVLQEGEFERLGGGRPIAVNVRVLAATHRDLESLVREGKLRADLFYRLNVFPIRSPALRERADDIPELVRYFVLKYAAKLGKRIDAVPSEVLDRLAAYQWPGNIRELANIIERSVILSRGTTLELQGQMPGMAAPAALSGDAVQADQERRRIADALEQTGWRVSGPKGAAVLLGVKPTTLEARMKRLGLKRPG